MSFFANRVRSALNYSTGAAESGLFPKIVGVEVTNLCNLECVMCPHSEMTRPKGTMEIDTFHRLIDEIKGRAEIVNLYGVGESLLVKNFFDYCAYAKGAGLTTCLSTNATVITPKITEKLVDCGLDFLILAVDGASQATYEQIRVGGEFEKTIAKCKLLLQEKIRKNASLNICLQIISMEATSEDVRRQKAMFTPEEQRAINQFRIKPHFDQFAQIPQKVKHRTPCFFLWDMMNITWDGKVSLCCFDYDSSHAVGNIQEQSVGAIWNGELIRQYRKKHRARQFDDMTMCKTCSFPELGYFSPLTIWGSTLISANFQRKLVPYVEKLHVLGRTRKLNEKLLQGVGQSVLPWWRRKEKPGQEGL